MSSDSSDKSKAPKCYLGRCNMCDNYEKQLVLERDMLQRALKLATEELESARSIHEDTIQSWRSERAASAATLATLRADVDSARAALAVAGDAAQQHGRRALQHVTTLTVEREQLQRRLDSLECDNAMLIGRFTKKAEEMQNEFIDLPDNVEELQLTLLELREKLICVQIGREEALEAEKVLRAQLLEHDAAAARADAELQRACAEQQQARSPL